MKIKGIGTISKEKAMSILTREGRKAVKTGLITTEELGQIRGYGKSVGNIQQ